MIPDLELAAGAYLREHASVIALDTRIVGQTPPDTGDSWVRLTELDAPQQPGSKADHLVPFLLQLDCYASASGLDGSQQKEVKLIARTIRAGLQDMPGVRDDAVVTSVRILSSPRIPDTDFEPARERVILTVEVHAHAAPS